MAIIVLPEYLVWMEQTVVRGTNTTYELYSASISLVLGRFVAMVVWPGYSRHLPREGHFVPAVNGTSSARICFDFF